MIGRLAVLALGVSLTAARSQDAQKWAQRGDAYREARQYDKAAEAYGEVVRLRPYDEDARFRLVQVYLIRQDFPRALQSIEEARRVFNRSPQIELALGVTYYGLRRFPEAVNQFFRTLSLAPDIPQPYLFLIRMPEHLHERMGVLERKAAEFAERNPESPIGYLVQAKAIIEQLPPTGYSAQAEKAAMLLNRTLALQETDSDAHYQLALLEERKPDLDAAVKHLERSIALKPDEAAPHYRLARVYAKLGRAEDAAREREIHEKLSEKVKTP